MSAAPLQRDASALAGCPEELAAVDWSSHGVALIRASSVVRRNDSVIVRIIIRDAQGERDAVLKQHTDRAGVSRPFAERARHEHEVLVRLGGSLSGAGGEIAFSVPRVVFSEPERGIVVLDAAQGKALDALMKETKRRGRVTQELAVPLRNAGRWLRTMHDRTPVSAEPVMAASQSTAAALRSLETIVRYDRWIRGHRARIEQALQRSDVPSQWSRLAGRHGDYWPGNIFVGEASVEVIDFEGFREGMPLEDVAYFHLFLELMFPRHQRLVPDLQNAFLRGYAGDGDLPDSRLLEMFRLREGLRVLSHKVGTGRFSISAIWARHALRRVILGALE